MPSQKSGGPSGGAVGHVIRYGGRAESGFLAEIVGVIDDVKQFGLDSLPVPEVFLPASQQPRGTMVLLVRTASNPAGLAPAAEGAIHSVDKEVPVRIHPMSLIVAESLHQREFLTLLLATFAVLALFLAGLGVFGVAAYAVASRKTEIGVRIALGARPDVLKCWVVMQALRFVILGCGIGVACSFFVLRMIRRQLFAVSPTDPYALGGTCVVLIAVALVATWLPARRAAPSILSRL